MKRPPVAILTAMMLAACGGVQYKQLTAHAESHLYYPGSRVVSNGGADEQSGLDSGRVPAKAATQLATAASMPEVYAWYEKELASRGWKLRKVETLNSGYELFTRGKSEVFQVSPASGEANYMILYLILPASCAGQDPIPIDRALANC